MKLTKTYKCVNCEEIFDEDDAGTYSEMVGEFWGDPAYETFICCPHCRSDFLEEIDDEKEEEEEEVEDD